MNSLFFSDLHSHNHEQFSKKLSNGRNSRLQDCLNIVAQAEELCKTYEIGTCFFLGDVFHSRTKLDVDTMASTYEAFKALSKSCKKLIMLCGNHDQHTRVGDVHSVEIFSDFAQVISTPEIISCGGYSAACYPSTSDIEGMKGWISKIPPCDLFLFHQGISEAAVGPYDMHVKCELSIQDLPFYKVRYCLGGDFHKRQFLNDGKFHYIGSPLQLSMGERGDVKCFTYIDSNWKIHSIPTQAPKFFQFESETEFQNSEADPSKDFIRLTLSDKSKVSSLKEKYPRIQVFLKADEKQILQRISSDIVSDDHKLLEAYVDQSTTEIDKVDLLLLGRELLAGN